MPQLVVDGIELYSEEEGSGPPVLMLHGGFCSLESLRAQSDELVRDHRVHAFERPGHGRSPDTDGEYGYADGVGQTLAYLDACGLGAVDVVGYSDGAIIGLLLAMDHPDRVRSLVAISANLDPSGFSHSPEAAGLPVLDPPVQEDAPGQPDPELAAYERLSPDGPGHAEAVIGKLLRLWGREPRIAPADLGRIGAPVLVMSGDRDHIRPDHSLRIAASIRGARLCIVPGTGHHLIRERPAFVAAEIRRFLRPDG